MQQAMNAGSNMVLLFLDASHFVMGCDWLGSVYCLARRFLRTFSGRFRYNVLGAMDFVSKRVLTVSNDSYITSTEVCEMLRKIAEEYHGKDIHLVLDNARYQRCKVVQELAAELHIQLDYMPPYSPNLNLIERLWKFVKSSLRTQCWYLDDFVLFKNAIDSIIASTTRENKAKIDTLIGEKVQLFDNLLPDIAGNISSGQKTGKAAA